MELLLSATISAVIYLIVPDILSPIETILFLITGIVVSFMSICWIKDQIECIRRKRQSLTIRKTKQRCEKVIDFPIRPRTRIIPAFRVREEA